MSVLHCFCCNHLAIEYKLNNLMKLGSACFNRFRIRICRTKLQPPFSEPRVDSPRSFSPTGDQRQGGYTERIPGTLSEDEARNLRVRDEVQWNSRSYEVVKLFVTLSEYRHKTPLNHVYLQNIFFECWGHTVSQNRQEVCWKAIRNIVPRWKQTRTQPG